MGNRVLYDQLALTGNGRSPMILSTRKGKQDHADSEQ